MASALGILVLMIPAKGRAEVVVEGSVESMRLEAVDAPLAEVFGALRRSFGIRARVPASFNQPVTGTYEGTLDYVVSRVLEDFDYVVKRSPRTTEIVLVNQRRHGDAMAGGEPGIVPVSRPAPIITVPPPQAARTRMPTPPGLTRNINSNDAAMARRRAAQQERARARPQPPGMPQRRMP